MLRLVAAIRDADAWFWKVWGQLSHRNRHWIVNVLLGLAIEAALQLARNVPAVVSIQNWTLDTAMRFGAQVVARNGGASPAIPMAFIDIDEATWRDPNWGHGEPFRAPRDGLARLIAYAINHDARYIVLDVIVEGSEDPGDSKTIKDLLAEDQAFAKTIENFVEDNKDSTAHLKPDQHIFFVRTLREPLPGMQDLVAPEIRPSVLDKVIADHHAQLHAVAPYFRVSRDGVLRDWQLWQTGCRRDAGTEMGSWEILPSVQLVIGDLAQSDNPSGETQSPERRTPFRWDEHAATGHCPLTLDADATIGVPVSKLRPDDARIWDWLRSSGFKNAEELDPPRNETVALTNRIFFRFRYAQDRSPIRLLPALAILKEMPHLDLEQNSLVVIGQSFDAARDQHATPLGVMPGPMVLINSLDSMLDPGFLHEPSAVIEYPITIGSIVLVGGLLAYLDYIVAFGVSLTMLLLLLVINYGVARWLGIWVDVAIPLLGISAHWVYVEIETFLLRRHASVATNTHRKEDE